MAKKRVRPFEIVYITDYKKGATDCDNNPLPEGLDILHSPDMLYGNPKEEIEEQTDWDGLIHGPGKVLFVFYFSRNGKEFGIVRNPSVK